MRFGMHLCKKEPKAEIATGTDNGRHNIEIRELHRNTGEEEE